LCWQRECIQAKQLVRGWCAAPLISWQMPRTRRQICCVTTLFSNWSRCSTQMASSTVTTDAVWQDVIWTDVGNFHPKLCTRQSIQPRS
jgi:hypothetical protein